MFLASTSKTHCHSWFRLESSDLAKNTTQLVTFISFVAEGRGFLSWNCWSCCEAIEIAAVMGSMTLSLSQTKTLSDDLSQSLICCTIALLRMARGTWGSEIAHWQMSKTKLGLGGWSPSSSLSEISSSFFSVSDAHILWIWEDLEFASDNLSIQYCWPVHLCGKGYSKPIWRFLRAWETNCWKQCDRNSQQTRPW